MKKVIQLNVTMDGEDSTGLISDGHHTFDELYRINARISEVLSDSSGGDWEKRFDKQFPFMAFERTEADRIIAEIVTERLQDAQEDIKAFIREEKRKVESEIKSALETIDWGEIIK